jgi:Holliday junction resolvase
LPNAVLDADNTVNSVDSEAMRNVLDIPKYLAAQGLIYSRATSDSNPYLERMQSRKAASKYFGRNAESLGAFFSKMNWLVNAALSPSGQLISPQQSLAIESRSWRDAIKQLVDAECIDQDEQNATIYFRSTEAAQFIRGGWLEEYAFHILRDEKLFDTRMSVTVTGEHIKNEFDVLACHGNQLLFIECKTLRFNENQNDNELVYKLSDLSEEARGLFGETWLLSAQPSTAILEERAQKSRIKLLGPAHLANLRQLAQQWMNQA